jgi:hypothetical protein
MARHIYIRSPVGVATMTKIYGGKKVILHNCSGGGGVKFHSHLYKCRDPHIHKLLTCMHAIFYPTFEYYVKCVNKMAKTYLVDSNRILYYS